MKHYLNYLAVLLLSLGNTYAQTISFTLSTDLIDPISGFSIRDCTVDMNGDYLDDIVRVQANGIYIDFQKPDHSFEQTFFPVNFFNAPSWSICAGDLDQNGFNDLLFGGGSAVSFVMANNNGTAYIEHMDPGDIFSQRSTLFDIDNDGDLDAFVCHDIGLSHPYRNDGTGAMVEDQNLIHTVDLPGNYAAIWVDYDNDGHTDLYITKCKGGAVPGNPARTNGLYRNNGDGTFTEAAAAANMDDNAQSWATVFEDFDNDGDFDAFIVNHDFQNRFKRNNGDGTFTDIIEQTGILSDDLGAWSNAAADFNNDGFVDIIAEMNPSLYINNGDLTFTGQNIPFDDGGIGDFNNDGFLDVIRGNQVYLNDGNDNNWVKINTRGIVSNINGIGARVKIYGEWGVQMREVRSGQSFTPMSSLCAHFGIGDATTIDSIVIRWPSGLTTALEHPAINTSHNMIEANCILAPAEITLIGQTQICAGETVELLVPDGFESHAWSTGATNPSLTVSEAGSYGLMLYDAAGCVSVANNIVITLIQDTPPSISSIGDLTICEGESVTLSTNSTENPVWSNGMEGQTIEVLESGRYSVSIDAFCSEEAILSLDSILVEIHYPIVPEIEQVYIDQNGVAFITVQGENIYWFETAEGGTAIAEGNNFQSAPLTENATFYTESHNVFGGLIGQGGKLGFDGGGGVPSIASYNLFDAFENFTIQTVEVFVPNGQTAGTRTIQLFDNNGILLQETHVNLAMGSQTIELNFDVLVGIDFSLRCAENNIFRNNNHVEYPYLIGEGVGEVTTSASGDGFYYYFYNWQIQTEEITCISERIPVDIVIVGINDLTEISHLRVFPNPAADKLNVELILLEQVDLYLSLTNSLGQLIMKEKLNIPGLGQYKHEVDVSQLAGGIYLLQLYNNEHSASMTIVVE